MPIMTQAEKDSFLTAYSWGNHALAGYLTPANTATVTNKTMDSYSNWIGANHIHYRIKATEPILAGQVLMGVGYNSGEDAYEVALWTVASGKPALGISHDDLTTGSFGLLAQAGQVRGLDTSALDEDTIYYPTDGGGLTKTKPTSGTYQAAVYVLRKHSSQGEVTVNFSDPVPVHWPTLSTLVSFDPSGTDLIGTDVNAVILELLGRIQTLEENSGKASTIICS